MKNMDENRIKIEQEFRTPLGVILSGFFCSGTDGAPEIKHYENGTAEILNTPGHKIEVISFKLKVPLKNGDTLAGSSGRIFRIEKTTGIHEKIETYCLLEKINHKVNFYPATGEHLDAIHAEGTEWTLHIGTEDSEIMNSRALNDDQFPSRFHNRTGITEMKPNGFVTSIPELNSGEKIHIHYLAAYDKRDEQKVNTWLAVDELKKNLENLIGIY